MNAGIVLATCLMAPLYTEIGPCDLTPCRCTDLDWEPSPTATSYEVERRTESDGETIVAGSVHEGCTDEGCYLFDSWSTTRDTSIPREAVNYLYRVRACNTRGCSAWTDWIANQGWPVACFSESGLEVQCHVGASCRVCGPNGCKTLGTPDCP